MDDQNFRIYFIYTQKGPKIKIELEPNEEIKKIDIISSGKILNNSYNLYCLTISNIKKEKYTTLTLIDNQGELYTANIHLNKDEPFQYNVKFESYHNDLANASLNQVKLSYQDQFTIFKNNLKNDKKIIYNLYLSRVNSFFQEMNNIIDYESLLVFLLELYAQYQQNNELKDIIKQFFEKINLKNIFYRLDNSPDIIDEKHILDNINIRANLVDIVNNKDEINEKIDVILSYFYLNSKQKQKLFIKYISKNNEENRIIKHLISNRNIFNNFSLDVINLPLMDDAEDLTQIISLLSLLPSIVDCFNLFSDYGFYVKLTYITQIEQKVINIMKINKPQKYDNIELLSNYFNIFYEHFLKEFSMPVAIKQDFYIEYCKLFLNEDLHKIKLIIGILNKYNKNLKDNFKIKIESELNSYYNQTGIYLINHQKLKNMDLINFLIDNKEINPAFNIDDCIILNDNDDVFVNDFLNDSFEEIKLKDLFGYHYKQLIQNIFDRMIVPKDILVIRNWKISSEANKEVIETFLLAIKRIWLNHPENHMYGLEDLIANEFGKASIKVINYKNVINELENHISKDFLLTIYSIILNKNYILSTEFRQHIINYIKTNQGYGPLSIWYFLSTLDDKYDKLNFLDLNLIKEYAVQKEDLINYPTITTDRITLFTNLYNGNFFDDYIGDSDYYLESIKVKDQISDIKFKDVMIMYKNILQFPNILVFFVPGKFKEENYILIESLLFDFSDKCGVSKEHYDKLKIILSFWNKFFQIEKNNERNNLKKKLTEYENTPLNNIDKLINETKWMLSFANEAKQGQKLAESIFFMEIYNNLKNKYDKNQERDRYNYAYKKFYELKSLGKNSNLNLLDLNLKDILEKAASENINKIDNELKFLQTFFGFNSNNKEYNNFNFKMIKKSLNRMVLKYQEKHGKEVNQDDLYKDDDDDDEIMEEEGNKVINVEKEDDNEFSLFSGDTGPENVNEKKEKKNNNYVEEMKKELINEILILSKIFFSNAKIYITDKYLNLGDMNQNMIIKRKEEKEEMYNSFINFFVKLFNTNKGFAKLNIKEIFDEIIFLSNNIYLKGINSCLFNEFEKEKDKKDLILISQFYDIIETLINERKLDKGIFLRILKKFDECYKNKYSDDEQIIGNFDNLFTEINENIEKEKIKNIFIDLLIREKKVLQSNNVLMNYIFKDDNDYNFYYLYEDLLPFINEILQEEINTKIKFDKVDNNWINFNSDYLKKLNEKIKGYKILEEIVLYYFETKIMNALNNKYNKKRDNEKELSRDEQLKTCLKICVETLEKEFDKSLGDKINKNITILCCIAFIKAFLNKFISFIINNYSLVNNIPDIFNIIKGSTFNEFRKSFKIYVLKLFFDNIGNYNEYNTPKLEANYQLSYINDEDIKQFFKENKLDSFSKLFGFDFMIIPNKVQNNNDNNDIGYFNKLLNELLLIKKNNVNNNVDDKDLISMINDKNDLDSFYCAIVNIHFSFLFNEKYINSDECNLINNWITNKMISKEITIFKENDMYQKILFCIKKQNKIYKNYNSLLSVLISARYVLNTLFNKNEDGFYYQLITNIQNIIKTEKNYLNYYLKDFNTYSNEQRDILYLTYKFINYIILSHLYFGNLLEKITIEDIKQILQINEDNITSDYILDLLTKEFIFIEKNILHLIGIKNIIIFMNNLYDNISSILVNIKFINDDKYIKNKEQEIDMIINDIISNYKTNVEKYYEITNEIGIYKDLQKNSNLYLEILYEEKELFVNDVSKLEKQFPFFTFLTSTNFCTYNDFKDQFLYNENYNNYPLISCILKNDNILELIDCIPDINLFINKVYNELNLKKSKEDINKKIRDVLSDKAIRLIENYNKALNKLKNIFSDNKDINIKEITQESLISEVINRKDNNINKMYYEIIKRYNEFLSSMKIFYNYNIINKKDNIDHIIIQNATENDYISFKLNRRNDNIGFNLNQNNNNEIKIKDRLEELIQIYSKRNRIVDNKINIYDGNKIIYYYELIENKLEKEFIFGKKLFDEKNQKLFIFSNEVYNEERNNIISELNTNYQQMEIKGELNNKLEEYLKNEKEIKKEDLINIYHDLQYIIITNYLNNYDPNKAGLGYIVKILEKSNYHINDSFKKLLEKYDDMLSLNNLIFFYEKMELKVFEYLTENIKINKKDYEKNKDAKNKMENIFKKNENIINKDLFLNCIKKYILRYCIGNNNDNNNILNNLKFDEFLQKNDVVSEEMKGDEKIKEYLEELKKINDENNYVIKYCINTLFKVEEINDSDDEDSDEDNNHKKNKHYIVDDDEDNGEHSDDDENNKYRKKKSKKIMNEDI